MWKDALSCRSRQLMQCLRRLYRHQSSAIVRCRRRRVGLVHSSSNWASAESVCLTPCKLLISLSCPQTSPSSLNGRFTDVHWWHHFRYVASFVFVFLFFCSVLLTFVFPVGHGSMYWSDASSAFWLIGWCNTTNCRELLQFVSVINSSKNHRHSKQLFVDNLLSQ